MMEEMKLVSSIDRSPGPVTPAMVAGHPISPGTAKASDHKGSRKEESDSPFAVSVSDVYEGPLDLLLDLIRKQDIDIYDIPIARITAQYLAYVEKIRELDVNVAADFIYMAAVLIHIKSKMLLPRDVFESVPERVRRCRGHGSGDRRRCH
jgi:segregation and condensation protein A